MKIQSIMTKDVATCSPHTDLAAVATLMWQRDCGIVPVVGEAGSVVGVITDRDICIAAATRGLPPSHIAASDAMSEPVHACMAGDDVSEALSVMKQFRVRRLPVIDKSGMLKGLLSMNDLVTAAGRAKGPAPKDVLATLSAICAHRPTRVTAV